MAFTLITITGSFQRPDGQPATGTLTATLSEAIVNTGAQLDPTPIRGVIFAGQLKAADGQAPFALYANDDPASVPADSSYRIVLALDGAPLLEAAALISHSAPAGTVDISTLI